MKLSFLWVMLSVISKILLKVEIILILTKVSLALFLFFFFFFLFFFASSRAAPTAYGGSQARGQIGAVAAGLHHSHSHTRSEPCLRPPPQLMAMPDP